MTRLVVLPFRLLRPDPEIDFLSLRPRRRGLGLARRAAVGRDSLERRRRSLRERVPGPQGARDAGRRRPRADRQPPAGGPTAARDGPARGGARAAPSCRPRRSRPRSATSSACRTSSRGGSWSCSRPLSPSARERGAAGCRRAPGPTSSTCGRARCCATGRTWRSPGTSTGSASTRTPRSRRGGPGSAAATACSPSTSSSSPSENMARADEAYRRALELDPDLPEAHKLYAHREAEIGRARDALVRLLGLARTTRNDPEIFAGLVHACRYCGLLEASEARPPRSAAARPAHLDERRLHLVGQGRHGAGRRGDVRRRGLRAADDGVPRAGAGGRGSQDPGAALHDVLPRVRDDQEGPRGDDRPEGGGRRPVRRARGRALRPRGDVHVRSLPGPPRRHEHARCRR